jgi:hypothetical protein
MKLMTIDPGVAAVAAALIALAGGAAGSLLTQWLGARREDRHSQPRASGCHGGRFVRKGLEPTLGFEPRTCCLRNSSHRWATEHEFVRGGFEIWGV